MIEKDAYLYLRNLQCLAHADGILSPEEEQFVEVARTKIGAKKSTFNRAIKEISDHVIDIKSLSRFSTRIRNIEDLIELALVGGELKSEEKNLIADAAKRGGMTQEIINTVFREAKQRREAASPLCSSCGAALPESARFCPECGVSKEVAPTNSIGRQVSIVVPDSGVTIAFAKSTSGRFPEALDLAKSLPTFQEATRDGKQWYAVTISPQDTSNLIGIANPLGGLKNKEVFLNGIKVDWKKVFGFAWCAGERENAYDPVKYCFGVEDERMNIWGCKQLQMDWTSWSDWFTYGKFVKGTVFEFDMKRIVHELEQKLEAVRLCPHLRIQFISEVLKQFPRKVKVGEGTGWSYREAYGPHPNAIKVKINRWGTTEMIDVVGVQPDDINPAKTVLSRAIKTSGQKDIKLKQLGIG